MVSVLQGLHAALRGEAPPPDVAPQEESQQQLEELVRFVPAAYMTASLGVSILMIGLDLAGPAA